MRYEIGFTQIVWGTIRVSASSLEGAIELARIQHDGWPARFENYEEPKYEYISCEEE